MNGSYEKEGEVEWRYATENLTEANRVYDVLDHGYLKVIETWGSDEGIIETARMSTAKGFLGWDAGPCPSCSRGVLPPEASGIAGTSPPAALSGESLRSGASLASSCHDCGGKGTIPGDAKLLRFLYENKHATPFEFAGLTIEIQAPVMVYREWHRHRTQSYSEMSARYVKMPDIHYVPSIGRIIQSSRASANRQVGGGGVLNMPGLYAAGNEEDRERQMAEQIRGLIRDEQERVYGFYEDLISFGVSKEVARLDTPVARYSRMRATGNLRNWLAFLTLRMAKGAQFEIRQFAWALAHAIEQIYPRTWALALEGMAPKKVFTPEMVAKIQQVRSLLEGARQDFTERGEIFPIGLHHAELRVEELIREAIR